MTPDEHSRRICELRAFIVTELWPDLDRLAGACNPATGPVGRRSLRMLARSIAVRLERAAEELRSLPFQ